MAGSATDPRLEKDAGKEKVNLRTASQGVTALLAAVLFCAAAGLATDDLAVLQQRFDAERDGVRKAKMLQKLGDAQFAKEREAAKAARSG